MGMESPGRKHLHHQPPDGVQPEEVFFITVCARPRNKNHFCNLVTGKIVLESIHQRHDRDVWYCHLALLMPDHIHLLLSFSGNKTLSRLVGEWKGWLGRFQGIPWQRNFFDHRLRKEESLMQKGDYILQNPVRAGLISDAKDWPYVWLPKD
jgi:putative transposase